MNVVYHIGSSDAPGNIITPVQLRGQNYDEWARAIRTALKAKRKFGFVEGTIVKPTTEEKLEDWVTVHSMLVSWLTNTIELSIRSTLGQYDDAQLLLNNLKSRFCVVNDARVCQLKIALGECKQEGGEPVAVYFGRLSKIWDELVTFVTVPMCSCGSCKCNIAAQVEKTKAKDYLHHFHIGLDAAYISIKTNLLAQEPLPILGRAYQQIIQAERLREGELLTSKGERENVMALKIQSDFRGEQKFVDEQTSFVLTVIVRGMKK